ncbi:Crp/Fnr family transcriptional regulator [Chryseobacterium indologenes]|uniref:Crp/Fnr family transcriptional regulator n=1 Tax=Chryseobacterium indologenes TaxID=253 RepID=A0A0N0ZVU1_CHRID|nr:Crp/Fnr family transcriptional regulator [Chryseobacterium indologenes]KPE51139.1 Crp/Fnr family transcriptional regulator [Chryseobacterium indologenes]
MLRTNQLFLDYIEDLYNKKENKGNIVLESFSKGEEMLIQNRKPSRIMLIKDGITKCFFVEENGKEYIVELLGRGEVIGEIELIRNIPCLCSIEALTEVCAYTLSIPYFQSLIKTDLVLNNLLLDVFAQRIINTSSRASYQQLYTTEHTLRQFLELQAQQGIHLSKEDMAAYLGITVRSLNRALKNLI